MNIYKPPLRNKSTFTFLKSVADLLKTPNDDEAAKLMTVFPIALKSISPHCHALVSAKCIAGISCLTHSEISAHTDRQHGVEGHSE